MTFCLLHGSCKNKQVDILISKNQALQKLYLKHHVYKLSWISNLTKSTKFDSHKKQTYPTVQTVTENTIKHKTHHITGQPSLQ